MQNLKYMPARRVLLMQKRTKGKGRIYKELIYWNQQRCTPRLGLKTVIIQHLHKDVLLKFDGLCSDDKIIGTGHSTISILKSRLEKYNKIAIDWFEKKHMQANPQNTRQW